MPEDLIEGMPPNMWYIGSGVVLFFCAFCLYQATKLLTGQYDIEAKFRERLIVFFIAIPAIIMMAFGVKNFNGFLVFSLMGALLGFLAGNPWKLIVGQKKDQADAEE